jgi:hypothetical protein
MIKAQVNNMSTPLQAEAQAMLLAAKVVHQLQLPNVTYRTDCQTLAVALSSPDPLAQPSHWSLRPCIAEIISIPDGSRRKILKIPRSINHQIAHKLAKQARQSVQHQCTFTCTQQVTVTLAQCSRHSVTLDGRTSLSSMYYVAKVYKVRNFSKKKDCREVRAGISAFRSLFVWLVADGWCWFVLREKYWLLVAGLL